MLRAVSKTAFRCAAPRPRWDPARSQCGSRSPRHRTGQRRDPDRRAGARSNCPTRSPPATVMLPQPCAAALEPARRAARPAKRPLLWLWRRPRATRAPRSAGCSTSAFGVCDQPWQGRGSFPRTTRCRSGVQPSTSRWRSSTPPATRWWSWARRLRSNETLKYKLKAAAAPIPHRRRSPTAGSLLRRRRLRPRRRRACARRSRRPPRRQG